MAQINKPSDYFNTKLYTGNGSTNSLTGVGFQPDWTWIKCRSNLESHEAYDVVRGVTKSLRPDTNGAETTQSTALTSFDSDGFTLGSDFEVNANSRTFASWNWLANGTASSNTDGSITSNVSANTTSGFSVVTYTGNATDNATVGHGLGVIPSVVIFKRRDSTSNWCVIGNNIGTAYTNFLELDGTGAFGSNTTILKSATSSTTLTLGTNARSNPSSGTMVAYCFTDVKGYSKFASYTGNGSTDGTFVYTGFKPAWVMIKKSSASGDNWHTWDSTRDTFNVVNKRLVPNDSVQEYSNFNVLDFCSNGFKLRDGSTYWNQSGGTFIYMCFAENPLVGTNNIPATAR